MSVAALPAIDTAAQSWLANASCVASSSTNASTVVPKGFRERRMETMAAKKRGWRRTQCSTGAAGLSRRRAPFVALDVRGASV